MAEYDELGHNAAIAKTVAHFEGQVPVEDVLAVIAPCLRMSIRDAVHR
jgi:hypothetical protein